MSGAPVAVFYLLTRVADPWQAVLGGFIVSAIVYWYNRKDRLIGTLTAFGFGIVAITAVIGIVSDSEKAYLTSGPIGDLLFVFLYLGSIAIGKPLIGGIVRELFPAYTSRIPPNAPVYVWLTAAWAGYDLFHGLIRVWMLMELSVGQYLVISRLAFWPVSAVMIALTGWAVLGAARRAQDPAVERLPFPKWWRQRLPAFVPERSRAEPPAETLPDA